MFQLRMSTKSFSFEFSVESRVLTTHLYLKERIVFSIEKEFIKTFKCASCSTKVEYEDQTMKLCGKCLDSFMKEWNKKLPS